MNGRVISVEFQEGSLVQQGQPLFRIDSDSLPTAVNEAKANLAKAEADQTKVLADEQRYKTLVEKGTISRQAYDDIINKVAQTKAALDAAQAQLNQAQTMLQESAIVSPYNGRIGRAQVKVGELVTANQTLMATVSTTESVRVDFALSERDYLELVRPILESDQPRPLIPVSLILADGSLYPETGLITFSDRRISSETGTFAVADAIVVVEAVEHHMAHKGLNARDATIRAMGEVSGPVIAPHWCSAQYLCRWRCWGVYPALCFVSLA